MNLLSSKAVTLQDIASEVGVHKSTVQRALHGDPRVEAGTIARINEVATRMGYDPEANHAARRLSLRKSGRGESTKLVALFFPLVSSRAPYFLRQFVGFMEVMSDAGFDVLTRILDRMGDQRLPPAVMRGDVDAMVALADPEWLTRQQNLFANMPAVRRPLITLINPVPGAWCATADFRQAGRMSIGHLLDLGHRRIITISNMSHQFAERVGGYRDELLARGMDPDKHLVALDCDNTIADWNEKVSDAIDRLLAACPDATGFLAPNDQLAGAAIGLFAERNRPVPEMMSLIGFDDTDPVPGPDHQNILTTVAVPLEQIGRQAARLALSPGDAPRTVILPTGLRVRGTTKAPKPA